MQASKVPYFVTVRNGPQKRSGCGGEEKNSQPPSIKPVVLRDFVYSLYFNINLILCIPCILEVEEYNGGGAC
jgi:hypothetical protein